MRLGPSPPGATGSSARWFAERIEALRREQSEMGRGARGASLERLLTSIEAKVEQLEEAPKAELTALAVELGSLALRIVELHGGRRAADDDEEREDE